MNIFRSSWGNPDIPGVVTKLVFLLGYPDDERKQEKIQEENESQEEQKQFHLGERDKVLAQRVE